MNIYIRKLASGRLYTRRDLVLQWIICEPGSCRVKPAPWPRQTVTARRAKHSAVGVTTTFAKRNTTVYCLLITATTLSASNQLLHLYFELWVLLRFIFHDKTMWRRGNVVTWRWRKLSSVAYFFPLVTREFERKANQILQFKDWLKEIKDSLEVNLLGKLFTTLQRLSSSLCR